MSEKNNGVTAKLSPLASLALVAVAAVAGFGAVYGTLGGSDNGGNTGKPALSLPEQTPPAPAPERAASAATASKLAAFVRKNPPKALSEVSFVDATGAPKTLADFKGKAVLLNLWATWCAPCREEMPSLDRLQKALGSDTFEVVALAVDRTGVEAAGKFLKSINVENLKLYADPTTKSGIALGVLGMPTTILITKDGLEAGRLSGPASWDSEEAKKLIADALKN
jgi:thiol-disulfide isomerase/thioredoxin